MNSPIRIKTFRSKTLQDAYQQIRTEFGPDAAILETKAARFGIFGRSRIEVTASSNTAEPFLSVYGSDTVESEIQSIESISPTEPNDTVSSQETIATSSTAATVNEPTENAVGSSAAPKERALESIHLKSADGIFRQVHQELIEAGIESGIALQWMEAARQKSSSISNVSITQDVWTLRSELLGWIRDLVHAAPPISLEGSRQRVLAFVGPCGSGKTTSLAKIAANLSIEHGLSVGVLSTDTVRLGSNFLLQNYAEILGWRLEVAESLEQLVSCMQALSDCRIVLVDTSGCSPSDPGTMERLSQILEMVNPTETHLVISSTTNTRSFMQCEQAFEQLKPNRLILSRLDESYGLGPLFPCLQSSTLPISYLTNGQKIPSDLIQATQSRIAQQVMALSAP